MTKKERTNKTLTMAESTKHYRMSNMNPLNRFKHKCDSQTFLRQQMELFAALSNLHCNKKKDNLFDIAK
jgi:hypothetical protein